VAADDLGGRRHLQVLADLAQRAREAVLVGDQQRRLARVDRAPAVGGVAGEQEPGTLQDKLGRRG
jgi:hypothetical protein